LVEIVLIALVVLELINGLDVHMFHLTVNMQYIVVLISDEDDLGIYSIHLFLEQIALV
jgi:hypothetical protein